MEQKWREKVIVGLSIASLVVVALLFSVIMRLLVLVGTMAEDKGTDFNTTNLFQNTCQGNKSLI